jgi:hypothetical protein
VTETSATEEAYRDDDEEDREDDPLIPVEQGRKQVAYGSAGPGPGSPPGQPTAPGPAPSSRPHVQVPLHRRFSSVILIDPIPLLLNLPTVSYNFLYRHPSHSFKPLVLQPHPRDKFKFNSNSVTTTDASTTAGPPTARSGPNWHDTLTTYLPRWWYGWNANEWQLYYFASRDSEVGRVLGREFWWWEGVVWREAFLGERSGGGGTGDVEDDHGVLADIDVQSGQEQGQEASGLVGGVLAPSTSSSESYSRFEPRNKSTKWRGDAAIFLSGSDQIINSTEIWQYLTLDAPLKEDGMVARWFSHPGSGSGLGGGHEEGEDNVASPVFDVDSEPPSATTSALSPPSTSRQRDRDLDRERQPSLRSAGPRQTLEVHFMPYLDHATIFDTSERRREMREVLERFGTRRE